MISANLSGEVDVHSYHWELDVIVGACLVHVKAHIVQKLNIARIEVFYICISKGPFIYCIAFSIVFSLI